MKNVTLTIYDVIDVLGREITIMICEVRSAKLTYVPNTGTYLVYKGKKPIFTSKLVKYYEHFRSFNGEEAIQCFNAL